MSKIFVSGLVNVETTVKIRQFPIDYYPIDYSFFGVKSSVAGVGFNLSKALTTLGDKVSLVSMTGDDFESEKVFKELESMGVSTQNIKKSLKETCTSAILYDETGRRQIYCDLKDIQDTDYEFTDEFADSDMVIACNIKYNKTLLKKAKAAGKTIATDVHVLSDINDDYNKAFMENADILFLSDEKIPGDYGDFLREIYNRYGNKIIVLGMGSKGAMMLCEGALYYMTPVKVDNVVNTVGAGDSLFASFLHFYAKGNDPVTCLKKAQIFASEKIKANGAAKGFVTEKRVNELFEITEFGVEIK